MAQRHIEMILMRQLASGLAMPVFLVDTRGHLVFYNESAETILGKRFDETGPMPIEEWSTAFAPFDDAGKPIDPESLPLVAAALHQKLGSLRFWIKGLDGAKRQIDVCAFPIIGQNHQMVGAAAIFGEVV